MQRVKINSKRTKGQEKNKARGKTNMQKGRPAILQKADQPFYRATNLTLSFFVAKRKREPLSVTNLHQ